jgi:hypothetical protein
MINASPRDDSDEAIKEAILSFAESHSKEWADADAEEPTFQDPPLFGDYCLSCSGGYLIVGKE